jgi:hypothetical protein
MTPKQVIEKVDKLKSDRGVWENHWQEIADYNLPRKNDVISRSGTSGEKKGQLVFDNTGIISSELLAGALHGMLTNPSSVFFGLTTGDDKIDMVDAIRLYLQDCTKKIINVLNNSNFQTEVHELYIDLVNFGTGNMSIEEDERNVVRFSTKFIGNYFIDEDSLGRVNQIYREWEWSPVQMVESFGEDALPEKIRREYRDGKCDTKYSVIHAVYPKTMVYDSKFKKDIISQFVIRQLSEQVKLEGFNELPYVTPRWSKLSEEKYGRSPAMNALPEIKTLNKMAEVMLQGAQKVVDPPVQLPDDGFVLPIITRPGGINYYRSGSTDIIKPVFNDTRIDFGYEVMKERRAKVRESFYVDQLMLNSGGPMMTATEVMQRTEEKMRLLGPMMGRMQNEFLRPLIDRVFNIMARREMFDIPPEELQGKVVDVKYSSLIAKSQKVSDGQNIMRVVQAIAPFIQLDPAVADNLNGDQALRVLADIYGLPAEVINDVAAVQQKRQQRAKEQQAAMQAAQQSQQADNYSKVVPAMAAAAQTGGANG